MDVTSIPELIAKHGKVAYAARETGLSEMTVQKYRHDVACRYHVIINGRLMTCRTTSLEIYKRK